MVYFQKGDLLFGHKERHQPDNLNERVGNGNRQNKKPGN
jgi:hypothetical protein